MMTRVKIYLLSVLLLLAADLGAGEAGVPQSELDALDRAIARETVSNQLGSQVLGELHRLKARLQRMGDATRSEKESALAPLDAGDDSQRRQLERLQAEARDGGRAARRSLALYYLYLNDPEKALAEWRRMGKATDFDMSYLLLASYLEMSLGEYNNGRRNLESALRLLESRTSLVLSTPVFCHNIGGYRIYVERPQGVLLPGEETLIYVEVEGAEFTDAPDGGSACKLMFGLKLKDDNQRTIWYEGEYGEYAPVFAGPIRDLHTALTWRVPNDLEAGRYHLHVEAVEDSTKRRGESILSFNVAKRETNPERRVTGGMPPEVMPKGLYEATKAFPGADVPPEAWGTRENKGTMDARQFEMLQDYYRRQKVE